MGEEKRGKKAKKQNKPPVGLEKPTPWLWPSSPLLTCSTWLATCPLCLARRAALLSLSERRPGCRSQDTSRALRGWSLRREGQGSEISSHFW